MTEHRVGEVSDWAPGSAHKVVVEGVAVAIVRIEDSFYAIGDTCSHANVSLSDGIVWEDECALECPKHGSVFDLKTGVPSALPATQPVAVYEVRVDGDHEVVEVSK